MKVWDKWLYPLSQKTRLNNHHPLKKKCKLPFYLAVLTFGAVAAARTGKVVKDFNLLATTKRAGV